VGVLAGLGLTAWAMLAALLVLIANIVFHACEHHLSETTDK
jgi:uncharacterized membrane protein YhiD involved in acid resistance